MKLTLIQKSAGIGVALILASAVIDQSVLSQSTLGKSVLSQSVLSQSVLSQSVLSQSVLSQSALPIGEQGSEQGNITTTPMPEPENDPNLPTSVTPNNQLDPNSDQGSDAAGNSVGDNSVGDNSNAYNDQADPSANQLAPANMPQEEPKKEFPWGLLGLLGLFGLFGRTRPSVSTANALTGTSAAGNLAGANTSSAGKES